MGKTPKSIKEEDVTKSPSSDLTSDKRSDDENDIHVEKVN